MPRSMRAPCSSSTVTISELPIQLAMCSGVELSLREGEQRRKSQYALKRMHISIDLAAFKQ